MPANGQSMVDLYVQNVLKYKAKTGQSSQRYQQKEIAIIKRQLDVREPLNYTNSQYELRFDLSEPKLWFVAKNIASPCQTIMAMCQLAVERGYLATNFY